MQTLSTQLHNDGILSITIDVKHEAMNVFNQEVIQEFTQLTKEIDNNNDINAVILMSGKTNSFIAGADIKMLQQAQTAEEGSAIVSHAHQMLEHIANSSKPFIAAIDGVCLGAGYELALACHYRIATDNPTTKIGLPEVMLGLLPGATGTSKLVRLISLPSALDMLLTGKQLSAKRALRLGMIDKIAPNKILAQTAIDTAKKIISQKYPKRKTPLLQRLLRLPLIGHLIIYKAKQQVIKKTKGLYPAPLAILDVVQYGINKPLKDALAYEAKKFGELTISPEAKQLINIYFATTELKKETFIKSNSQAQTIKKVGVLGGGLMGSGIATITIDKTHANVRMKDVHQKGITGAHRHINQYYQSRTQRGILSQEHAKKKKNRFTGSLDYSGFKSCNLVIEAVFEDIHLKHEMISDIESLGNPTTIFASNTSSIPLTEIAAQAQRPENIIGMHYFSPVEKMPLLEIIKHKKTSDQTIVSAVEFGKKQGKTVIVVNDGAGFYVNRILAPYINAALALGAEGIAFDKIDNALSGFGFPVGPFKLLDEVGIDVGSKIQPILEQAFGERMRSNSIQQSLLAQGRLGKKVGKGFYHYNNPKDNGIDKSLYAELNITPTTEMAEQEIIERCIYPMLNEAALCLEEGIISTARDGDIGAIFGIGFPPFLGGPFRYMDTLGIKQVVETLQRLETINNGKCIAAKSLLRMKNDNMNFY